MNLRNLCDRVKNYDGEVNSKLSSIIIRIKKCETDYLLKMEDLNNKFEFEKQAIDDSNFKKNEKISLFRQKVQEKERDREEKTRMKAQKKQIKEAKSYEDEMEEQRIINERNMEEILSKCKKAKPKK